MYVGLSRAKQALMVCDKQAPGFNYRGRSGELLPDTAQARKRRQFYTHRGRVGSVAMEIAADGNGQLILLGQALQVRHLVSGLPTTGNLDCRAPGGDEIDDDRADHPVE